MVTACRDTDAVRVALNNATIPTVGPTYTRFMGGSDESRVGDLVVGYPVAKSPEEAQRKPFLKTADLRS